MATSYKFVTLTNLETFATSLKEYLNVSKISSEGKFVKSVSAVDGQLSAELDDITANVVKYKSGTLAAALGEIESRLASAADDFGVTVTEKSAPNSGYLKTYVVEQNGESVGEIDIPKDFLVTSGEITEGTDGNSGKKVLKLTLNTKDGGETGSSVEIPVEDLCDVYRAGNGLAEASNTFSVKLDSNTEEFLTVGEGGLKLSGVQNAINSAVSGLESSLGDRLDDVEEMLGISGDGEGETVEDQINDAIDTAVNALNSTKFDETENIKVTVTQTDGLITSVEVEELNELATKEQVEALEAAAITVKAGDGISITGESTEKTISIDTNLFEEVSEDAIKALFA